jgi:DNA methylase
VRSELEGVGGATQEALYASIDLELSWSEDQLPQAERTKHVHGLHPYLGKFVPQLVEVFLHRYFHPASRVYDPFAGCGTTLVEANAFGVGAVGCDISAFNCLLARVKTARYPLGELELGLRGVLEESRRLPRSTRGATAWLRRWYSPQALAELLAYRRASSRLEPPYEDVARVILSRAARSARLTTHFDLDFPREPVTGPYRCRKHKRECQPVTEAGKFLARYTADTVQRLRAFSSVRAPSQVKVVHGDARRIRVAQASGVITSPPYPGLIDYHEQHRYAYELLDLPDRRKLEIGAAAFGRGRAALSRYVAAMSEVFTNTSRQLVGGSPVVIVVADSHDLYPAILDRAGLLLEERITRHVNRRTGRRAGEFFEDVLVCRAP